MFTSLAKKLNGNLNVCDKGLVLHGLTFRAFLGKTAVPLVFGSVF